MKHYQPTPLFASERSFTVDNLFSEIKTDAERKLARHNLGIEDKDSLDWGVIKGNITDLKDLIDILDYALNNLDKKHNYMLDKLAENILNKIKDLDIDVTLPEDAEYFKNHISRKCQEVLDVTLDELRKSKEEIISYIVGLQSDIIQNVKVMQQEILDNVLKESAEIKKLLKDSYNKQDALAKSVDELKLMIASK